MAQMALTVSVFWLYLTAPLPESTWRTPYGVPVLVLGSWGPVLLGFGEPFAES